MSTIKYDKENPGHFGIYHQTSEHGRSKYHFECAFCNSDVEAYIWSMAASGKKCPSCGAIHYRSGIAYKQIK